jgi:hypothetical protein
MSDNPLRGIAAMSRVFKRDARGFIMTDATGKIILEPEPAIKAEPPTTITPQFPKTVPRPALNRRPHHARWTFTAKSSLAPRLP